MSAHAARPAPLFEFRGSPHRLHALWSALVKPARLRRDMAKLSNHLLLDIGVDPRKVVRPAREAADRLSLLERGWPPRRGF